MEAEHDVGPRQVHLVEGPIAEAAAADEFRAVGPIPQQDALLHDLKESRVRHHFTGGRKGDQEGAWIWPCSVVIRLALAPSAFIT